MEGQPPRRAEDGDGVGDVVQGLVMGLDVAAQGVARLLGLGHVQGEGQHPAAGRGLGHDPPGAAAPAARGPAEAFLTLMQAAGFGHDGVGAAVEGQGLVARGLDGLDLHLRQPGAVGPGQSPARVDHPGRGRIVVGQQAQTALGGGAHQAQTRHAQPGRAGAGPALDGPGARLALQHGVKGLAPLDQGVQTRTGGGANRVQNHEGGIIGENFGAVRQITDDHIPGGGRTQPVGPAPGRQGDADILEGGQRAVTGGQVAVGVGDRRLQRAVPVGQPPTQPRGPGAERQGEARGARGRDIGDVRLGHCVRSAPALIR